MAIRENIALVQQAYAAVAQGEIPRLIEMMAEDVAIHLPGPEEIPFAGTYRAWDTDWVMVWTIEDGQITALREFHQTAAIARAFTTDDP